MQSACHPRCTGWGVIIRHASWEVGKNPLGHPTANMLKISVKRTWQFKRVRDAVGRLDQFFRTLDEFGLKKPW